MFSDYRPVSTACSVAFTAEVRADGRPIVRRRLNDIAINTALDPQAVHTSRLLTF